MIWIAVGVVSLAVMAGPLAVLRLAHSLQAVPAPSRLARRRPS